MSTYRRFNPQMQWRRPRSSNSPLSIHKVKVCENCGQEFKKRNACDAEGRTLPTMVGIGKRFCSQACMLDFRFKAKRSEKATRAADSASQYGLMSANRRAKSAKLRPIILAARGAVCEICLVDFSEDSYLLDLHHLDRDPSNNDDENLAVLCALCHRKVHKGRATYKRSVSCCTKGTYVMV